MRREPFSVSASSDKNGVVTITIAGSVDETAVFPDLKVENKVVMKLGRVTGLNSIGTRAWCLWIGRFKPPVLVDLQECPVVFVKSFTTVKGFLPGNCEVKSLYIPFYSEDTGERKDFLAMRGEHFLPNGELKLPELKDSKGNPMEMDIIPESYLAFLTA